MKGGLQVYNEQAKLAEGRRLCPSVGVVECLCVSGIISMVSMFCPTIKPFVIAQKTFLFANAPKIPLAAQSCSARSRRPLRMI